MDLPTFSEFKTEYNVLDCEEAKKQYSDLNMDEYEVPQPKLLQFAGDTWAMHLSDGTYYTNISRMEHTGTFDEVAAYVFFDHYISECTNPTEFSTEYMTTVLNEFCAWQGLEPASADEILHDIQSKPANTLTGRDLANAAWLEWFCDQWKTTQTIEDENAVTP